MKKVIILSFSFILFLFIHPSPTLAEQKETSRIASAEAALILEQIKQLREDTSEQIRQLREDMNKRFEQVDKRFEQVDKRFEQVDKRFEFIQLLLITILGVLLGGTIYNILLSRRIPKELNTYLERIRNIEIMVKEMVSRDPQLMEHFKNIGVL